MTAIAGLVHDGHVTIGADSAAVGGWNLTIRADPKVFRNGHYLIGYTDSYRMGQLLRYGLQPPEPKGDLLQLMCTGFIDAVRRCLDEGGWSQRKESQEQGGTFLVGVAGRLFTIHQDYQVAEAADAYAACGCGIDVVLGAFHASRSGRASATAKVRAALTAAEHHNAGVRGPFIVHTLRARDR